jgi:hypothetical protein
VVVLDPRRTPELNRHDLGRFSDPVKRRGMQ